MSELRHEDAAQAAYEGVAEFGPSYFRVEEKCEREYTRMELAEDRHRFDDDGRVF